MNNEDRVQWIIDTEDKLDITFNGGQLGILLGNKVNYLNRREGKTFSLICKAIMETSYESNTRVCFTSLYNNCICYAFKNTCEVLNKLNINFKTNKHKIILNNNSEIEFISKNNINRGINMFDFILLDDFKRASEFPSIIGNESIFTFTPEFLDSNADVTIRRMEREQNRWH